MFAGGLLSNEFGQKSPMPQDVKNAYLMFADDKIRNLVSSEFSFSVPSRKIAHQ